MKILVIAILFSACTTTKLETVPAADCGLAPDAPGRAVALDQTTGNATMSIADYQALSTWQDDMETWTNCVYSTTAP